MVNNNEMEIVIFDMLGTNYYYSCDLKTANFYHERAMLDDNELPDSENKVLSLKNIN